MTSLSLSDALKHRTRVGQVTEKTATLIPFPPLSNFRERQLVGVIVLLENLEQALLH